MIPGYNVTDDVSQCIRKMYLSAKLTYTPTVVSIFSFFTPVPEDDNHHHRDSAVLSDLGAKSWRTYLRSSCASYQISKFPKNPTIKKNKMRRT